MAQKHRLSALLAKDSQRAEQTFKAEASLL